MPMSVHDAVRANPHVVTIATLLNQVEKLVECAGRRKQQLSVSSSIKDVIYNVLFENPWSSRHLSFLLSMSLQQATDV
jgi:hypothetical protein